MAGTAGPMLLDPGSSHLSIFHAFGLCVFLLDHSVPSPLAIAPRLFSVQFRSILSENTIILSLVSGFSKLLCTPNLCSGQLLVLAGLKD